MIAYPAVDLRGGRAVQLVGGAVERTAIELPEPVAVARRWVEAGFAALHLVDLDGALGTGDNHTILRRIAAEAGVPVQVGGGLRDTAAVERALAAGAARAVVGTRAIGDPEWLAAIAAAHPGRIVVAADCREGEILTHGWTRRSGMGAAEFLAGLSALPLGAVLVTDVGREGRLAGIDAAWFAELAAASPHPLIAAGGIAGAADLTALAAAGVAGAVLGMALYAAVLDPRQVAKEHCR